MKNMFVNHTFNHVILSFTYCFCQQKLAWMFFMRLLVGGHPWGGRDVGVNKEVVSTTRRRVKDQIDDGKEWKNNAKEKETKGNVIDVLLCNRSLKRWRWGPAYDLVPVTMKWRLDAKYNIKRNHKYHKCRFRKVGLSKSSRADLLADVCTQTSVKLHIQEDPKSRQRHV